MPLPTLTARATSFGVAQWTHHVVNLFGLLVLLTRFASSATAAPPTPPPPPPPLPPFRFSQTFGDHMVLAPPVVIWGYGKPGENVYTVVGDYGRHTQPPPIGGNTIVGMDGIWRQPLGSLHEGLYNFSITSVMGNTDTIELHDVMIGKVILCSGQSNIELVVMSKALNATDEVASCGDHQYVRIAQVTEENAGAPQDDLTLKRPWSIPDPTNCASYSATCYFVARELSDKLNNSVAVGVIESAVGGTAIRNWVPEEALADCSQPWSGLEPYGWHPYTHSTLYNDMIHPFGTGPTAFSLVVWDQAESDSFPQTFPGYYGCQTLAHINSWRSRFAAPNLPWIFVHLQPYTGSENGATPLQMNVSQLVGNALAELRHNQLNALQLPLVGYASAIDLGDPSSPYGNVHFRHKQTIARRIVSAALAIAFNVSGGSGGSLAYPPPRFMKQIPSRDSCAMTISFLQAGAGPKSLMFSTTNDPSTSNTSAKCPSSVQGSCGGFEIFCTTSEIPHNATNPALWLPATATLSQDKSSLMLTADSDQAKGLVARASRYAWAEWPLSTLFASGNNNDHGLPVLPWNQGLTCTGGALPNAAC